MFLSCKGMFIVEMLIVGIGRGIWSVASKGYEGEDSGSWSLSVLHGEGGGGWSTDWPVAFSVWRRFLRSVSRDISKLFQAMSFFSGLEPLGTLRSIILNLK